MWQNGDLMVDLIKFIVVNGDLMGFNGDLTRFNWQKSDLIGFNGDSMGFSVI